MRVLTTACGDIELPEGTPAAATRTPWEWRRLLSLGSSWSFDEALAMWEAVEGFRAAPAYDTFESEAAPAKYLTQLVRGARARVYDSVGLKARGAQLERVREVEEYRRRLEGRGRQPKAGGRVKL